MQKPEPVEQIEGQQEIPLILGTNSRESDPALVAWMQGYVSALEIADARMFRDSIRKLRTEYGYADESEKRVSDSILGRIDADGKGVTE